MTSDDFFTVVKLAPANTDQYSPDYAFLVNVVAVTQGGVGSYLFGSLPSQANANTILTAARGDALGRTMFRSTQVKPVIKTSSGGVQQQYRDAPMTMFRVDIASQSATVYFDPKRQAATVANYKNLYKVAGIVLPEDSALDSIVVNPAGDASYFLEQVLRAVAADLAHPETTLPVPSPTPVTKTAIPVASLATLDPDTIEVNVPIVTSIDFFPALVFTTREVVTVTFSRAGLESVVELPVGFPLVIRGFTANEIRAEEFVTRYYPPDANTIVSPVPRGSLALINAKIPLVKVPTDQVAANPIYQTALGNLRDHARRTNTVRRDLLSLVNDASFPAAGRGGTGGAGGVGDLGGGPPPPGGGVGDLGGGPPPPPPPPPPGGDGGQSAMLEGLRRTDDHLQVHLNTANGLPFNEVVDPAERASLERERETLREEIERVRTGIRRTLTTPPQEPTVIETMRAHVAAEEAAIITLVTNLNAHFDRVRSPPGPTGGPPPGPTGGPEPPGPTGGPEPPGPTGGPEPPGPTGGPEPPGPTGGPEPPGPTGGPEPPGPTGPTGGPEDVPPSPPEPSLRSSYFVDPFYSAVKRISDSELQSDSAVRDVIDQFEAWLSKDPPPRLRRLGPGTTYDAYMDDAVERSFLVGGIGGLIAETRGKPTVVEGLLAAAESLPESDGFRDVLTQQIKTWERQYAVREGEGAPAPSAPVPPSREEERKEGEEGERPTPAIRFNDLLPQMKSFIETRPELLVRQAQFGPIRFKYDTDDRMNAKIADAVAKFGGRPEAFQLIPPVLDAARSTDTRKRYIVKAQRPAVNFAIVTWNITSAGPASWNAAIKVTNAQGGGARTKASVVIVQFYIVPVAPPVPPAPPVVAPAPTVASEQPAAPTVASEQPAAPTVASEQPAAPTVASEQPVTPPPEPVPPPQFPPGRAEIPILPPAVEESADLPGQVPSRPSTPPVEPPLPPVVPATAPLPPGFEPTRVQHIALKTEGLPDGDTPPKTITIYTTFPGKPPMQDTLTYDPSQGEVIRVKRGMDDRGKIEAFPVNGFVYKSSDPEFGSYVLYNPIYKTVVFLIRRGGRRRTLKRGGRRSRRATYTRQRQR